MFTNPATLFSRVSSCGSAVPSCAQKEQMVVGGDRQGFTDAQSFDRKLSVTAKSGGWGYSRESRVGDPDKGDKVNRLLASNILTGRTGVSRNHHKSVFDAKGCYDGGCSVSMESRELSQAAKSGMRKTQKAAAKKMW